ncbi:ABC transporter substrate-binding protein [Shinella sp. BYT-45]|uniref:ABC transporter substrate-binding protein n=1 Tax=Shinella sp. BYT-45 TaxID=3377377 RepID=UPI0039808B38
MSSALAIAATGIPAMAAETGEFTDAKIDWQQFKGQDVNILLVRHPWQEAIEPLVPQFEELTGIKVNLRKLPEPQFLAKVPADLTAGTFQFDVMMTQIAQNLQYHSKKWLSPIDVYMKDPKLTDSDWYDWNDFFPGAQAAATIGGTPFYNLAITAEAQILAYRKDVFEQLGLSVPKTFGELADAARTIKEKGGMDGITLRGGPTLWWPLLGAVESFGGSYLDENQKPVLDSEGTIAGVEAYVELAKYAPQGVTNYDWDEINTAMLSGQAAMFLDANVVYPRLKDATLSNLADKFAVTAYPAGPNGARSDSHYWTISMAGNAKNKEAAWLFMQWATSKPVQRDLALAGILAPRHSAWEGQALVDALGSDLIEAVKTSLSTATLYPANEHWTELADALRVEVQNALTGSKPVKQAMADAQARWVKILE